MLQNAIRIGDTTSHGGRVLSGNSRYIIIGKPVACVGDTVFCPLCKMPTVIVEGDSSWSVDGRNVAVAGCKTSCGAVLIPSQGNVFGDRAASSMAASAAGSAPATNAEMTPIIGSETAGILKRYANAATGGTAFPEHLTAAEEKGIGSKIRDTYGGNDTIQNQADIEAYNNKDSALGVKHGQIFNASQTAVGVLGAAEGGLALSRMGSSTAGSALQSFTGKYKGAPVTLENIEMRNINYVRRDPASVTAFRKEFNTKTRKDFLKKIGDDPDSIADMKGAGMSDGEIAEVARGEVPDGYNVHHKLPLDDGGTNDFDNLVLIRNTPEHSAITTYQQNTTRNLPYGESVNLDFPVPPGTVYPVK